MFKIFVWQALFLVCSKNEDVIIAVSIISHTGDKDLTVHVVPSKWKETNE